MSEKGTLARSWSLLEASFEILRKNKVLMVYPATGVAFISAIVMFFLGFGAPQWVLGSRPIFFAFYLVMMFGFTFTSAAFTHETLAAFSGEPVSLSRGFAFARRRIKAILLWSLFAGLVGLLIRNLEQRFGFVGSLILKITGVVWSVASVFAIQVMIREETANPFELLRKSSATLKRTWKDSLVGYVGIGIITSLIVSVVLVAVLVGGIFLQSGSSPQRGIVLAVLAGVIFFLTILVTTSLDSIFRCALYIYASEGVAPAPYSPELMDGAWKVRKQ
jgi:hypothetical protein